MYTSFFIIGSLCVLFSGIACLPLICDFLIFHESVCHSFFIFIIFSLFLGVTLILSSYKNIRNSFEAHTTIILTVLLWIISPLITAIPLYSWDPAITYVNSCFETVCAFTTTGSTIDPIRLPKAILMWLCLLQWLGGVGIIVTAMTFFSALRVGGIQLLHREFSTDHGDKFLPRASVIASSTILVYTSITSICFLFCYLFGMPFFYAFCHSLSIIPTGGILPYEMINNNGLKIVTSVFMVIGASPLILFVRIWHGEWRAIFRNAQFKGYLLFLTIASLIIVGWRYYTEDSFPVIDIIFHVTSISSTTGYFSWPWCESFPTIVLTILGIVGGCMGSTAGGLKIFRVQILSILTKMHMLQHSHPHSVYVPTYQKQKIQNDIPLSVLSFFLIFFITIVIVILTLSFLGHDINSCIACTLGSITNSGTGFAYALGWKGVYEDFEAPGRICLMFSMIMGRLEMITPFLFLMPSFWKKYQK